MSQHNISTIAVIRALTERGAALFSQELNWLNPLPQKIGEVLRKIEAASERAEYIQGVTGKESDDVANLCALKNEIEAALQDMSKSN